MSCDCTPPVNIHEAADLPDAVLGWEDPDAKPSRWDWFRYTFVGVPALMSIASFAHTVVHAALFALGLPCIF